jgi:Flp pilus assembly protein TadB
MTQESNRGDINISRVPVEGVGGLGLLAMAGIVTYFVEPLRWLGVATLVGGTIVGLVLLATRHRELRRLAMVLMTVLGVVLAGGVVKYLLER